MGWSPPQWLKETRGLWQLSQLIVVVQRAWVRIQGSVIFLLVKLPVHWLAWLALFLRVEIWWKPIALITVNSDNEGKLLVKFQTIILFEKEKGSNLPKSELAEQIKLLFEEKGKRAKMTEELPLRDFSIIFLPMKFEPSDVKRSLKLKKLKGPISPKNHDL